MRPGNIISSFLEGEYLPIAKASQQYWNILCQMPLQPANADTVAWLRKSDTWPHIKHGCGETVEQY